MFRFLLLPVLLFALLGSVYVLPERGRVAESAIRMDLPLSLGAWQGRELAVSQKEIDILGPDTEFAKMEYRRKHGEPVWPGGRQDFDFVNVSIVLSGYDINTSIHRPERCLPAQGHQICGSADAVVDLDNGRQFKVRRLNSRQARRVSRDSSEVVTVDSLIYYFFVGHDRVTNDHYERTFIDMRDRLIKGNDQRWAYVTVATAQGQLPWSGRTISAEQAEANLQEICKLVAERMIDWDAVK